YVTQRKLDGRPKFLVALRQAIPVRPEFGRARQDQFLSVKRLNPVDECRAVYFFEDIGPDLERVVGTDTDEVPIERLVVERAECEAVAHHRLAVGARIRNDVGGVQELFVAEPAEGALASVSL